MTPGKPDGGTGTYPTDTLIPFLCSCCHNRTLQQYRLLSVTSRTPDQTLFGLDHKIAAEDEKAGLTFFLNLLSVLSVAENPGDGQDDLGRRNHRVDREPRRIKLLGSSLERSE
jgi:hypothetical protein